MAGASRAMIRNYADDLRLFPTAAKRVSLVALIALYLLVPWLINDEWGRVLALAGVVAIGAIGLNLLTGYTGQPSLGMAAFIGLGAFTGGNEGSPMPIKADISLGFWSINFLKPTVLGKELGPKQGLMYLAWGFVIVTALLVKNIVRTRPGRALQAVRDRDVAAEIVGV